MGEKTLLLIGGGHAHIQVVVALSDVTHVRKVLVSDDDVAVYSGLLPAAVAGLRAAHDAEVDLRALCGAHGWHFVCARALALDPAARVATVRPRAGPALRLPYDVVSLDVGSATRPIPGAAAAPGDALPMTLATRPIGRLVAGVEAFEAAVRAAAAAAATAAPGAPRAVDVLVAGGGAAGAEVALALRARLRRTLRGACGARVALAAPARALDAQFGRALGRAVRGALRARGVEVVRARVAAVRAGAGVAELAGGGERRFDLLVAATGAAAHPWLRAASGLAVDERGFVRVTPALQAEGWPTAFAAGDCASFGDAFGDGFPPKAGVYAVRQGPVLAHNVRVAVGAAPSPLREFAPQKSFLTLLSTGDGSAIGAKYGVAFAGTWVYHLKTYIDDAWQARFRVGDAGAGKNAAEERVPFKGSPEEGAAWLLAASDVCKSDTFETQLAVLQRMDGDEEFRKTLVEFVDTKDDQCGAPDL